MKHRKTAKEFIKVIKAIASKEENLENLESYLSYHFETWMQKYANTPEGLIYELRAFAEMEA